MTTSNHDLEATIYALGYLEDGKYYKSKDCLNATKDLIRYLRRDDETQMITRRELLKADIITNDLIPILKDLKYNGSNSKDKDLFDVVLRLLVNLSQSAIMCFNNELPNDKLVRNIFIEIDNYLQKAKAAFVDESFNRSLCSTLKDILSKNWEQRPEEENCLIERIFFMIRNVLFIRNFDNVSADLTTNLHDSLIQSLSNAGLFEVLIEVCNSSKHSLYTLQVLDILKLLLREQNPANLAKVNELHLSKRTEFEREKDNEELLRIKKRDEHLRNHSKLLLNSRHSRFAGTYVAVNVKSINDQNNQICHKTVKSIDELLGDECKRVKRKPKNRVPIEEADEAQQFKSNAKVRMILMRFCKDLIKNSYKNLMKSINGHMQRKNLEDEQIISYFWLVKFLMEFNRNSDTPVQEKLDEIKETFLLEIMHSILVQIERCQEMIRLEKKQIRLWSKRLHIALQCFKEYLLTLYYFDKMNCDDKDDIQIEMLNQESKDLLITIKNQIFYIQEFRELLVNMLKDYDDTKLPLSFLKDLVEANNTFLDMFECYTKERGEIQVQSKKKSRKHVKKITKKKRDLTEEELEKERQEREKKFNEISERISSMLKLDSSELQTNDEQLFPFDFANQDCENDSKKDEVIIQIQKYLTMGKLDHGVALLREARYIWLNEKDLFGFNGITQDEEFDLLKALFMKIIDEDHLPEKNIDGRETQNRDDADHDQEYNEDSQEEEDSNEIVKEERLDYLTFLSRYANPRVVRCHVSVLKDYQNNSDYVTMCCLNMFNRISNECKLHEYLYQLSLFHLINKMHKDPLKNYLNAIDSSSSSQKMFDFFKDLLKKFFTSQQENPKMVLELLHFKNSRYVSEILKGPKVAKIKAKCWTSEEDNELKNLFEALKSQEDLEENTYERGDLVDHLMMKISDGSRTRRDVTNQLLRLELVKSKDDLKESNKKHLGRSRIWRQEDVDELKENFKKLKIDEEKNHLIELKESLKIKRSKKEIVCKLLELNLIASKSEITGKRKQNLKKIKSKNDDLFTAGESSDDDLLNSSVDDSTCDDDKNDSPSKEENSKKEQIHDESGDLGLHMSDDDDDDESLKLVDLNRNKSSPKKSTFSRNIIETKQKKRVNALDSDECNDDEVSKENNVIKEINDESSKRKRQRIAIISDDDE